MYDGKYTGIGYYNMGDGKVGNKSIFGKFGRTGNGTPETCYTDSETSQIRIGNSVESYHVRGGNQTAENGARPSGHSAEERSTVDRGRVCGVYDHKSESGGHVIHDVCESTIQSNDCKGRCQLVGREKRNVQMSNFRKIPFRPLLVGLPTRSSLAPRPNVDRFEEGISQIDGGSLGRDTVDTKRLREYPKKALAPGEFLLEDGSSDSKQNGRVGKDKERADTNDWLEWSEFYGHTLEEVYQDFATEPKSNAIYLGYDVGSQRDATNATAGIGIRKTSAIPSDGHQGSRDVSGVGGFQQAFDEKRRCNVGDGGGNKSSVTGGDIEAQVVDGNGCPYNYNRLPSNLSTLETTCIHRTSGGIEEDERNIPETQLRFVQSIVDGVRSPKIPEYLVSVPDGYVLHAPKMNNVNIIEIEAAWTRAGFAHRWKIVSEALVNLEEPTVQHQRLRCRISEVSRKVLDELRSAEIIDAQETQESTVMDLKKSGKLDNMALLWLRAEVGAGKKRCRVITWPYKLNERCREMGYIPDVPLVDAVDMLKFVHKGTFAFALDVKCSFFQWDLAAIANTTSPMNDGERVRKWYRLYIRTDDGKYWKAHQRRMAMGMVASPEMLNTSLRSAAYDAHIFGVFAYIHIDNMILVGSKEQVLLYADMVLHRLSVMGIVLGSKVQGEMVEFCGFALNFVLKTVTLAEKGIRKLQFIQRTVRAETTVGEYLRQIGSLNYYARVLWYFDTRNYACDYFDVILGLRKIGSDMQIGLKLSSIITFPALRRFQVWITKLLKSLIMYKGLKVPNTNKPPAVVYITDAWIQYGVAFCILRKGRVVIGYQSVVQDAENVNALEMHGLTLAVESDDFSSEPDEACLWIGDNNPSLFCCMKKRTRSSAINNELMYLLRALSRRNRIIVETKYVGSKQNPMDPRSRGLPTPKWALSSLAHYHLEYFGVTIPLESIVEVEVK